MRTLIKTAAIALVLIGGGIAAMGPVRSYWQDRNRPEYRFTKVSRGEITWVANATGTIKPLNTVQIGTFVSGPIKEIFVDFNSQVREGEKLAKIDPRIYEAGVARDRAGLATRQADVDRIGALLNKAVNDEKRAMALRKENPDFISQQEIDEVRFNRLALEAQLLSAKAAVQEAEAGLAISESQLYYTDIISPVDGIVIERAIDPGQTVAASFQTPKLFVVAPDLDKEVRIHATVDEADIGLIKKAQERKQPVRFTVDAYPDSLFEGEIIQVRMSSETTQNVVTYPVIIRADNADLKLLPGMTANISFQIDMHEDVLRVPNAALRFVPEMSEVHPRDRARLAGFAPQSDDSAAVGDAVMSADDKVAASQLRNRRQVWVDDGEFLRAVPVLTGMSDNHHSEIVSSALEEGDRLVVARQAEKQLLLW